jgi:S1-C subfamily serine protease
VRMSMRGRVVVFLLVAVIAGAVAGALTAWAFDDDSTANGSGVGAVSDPPPPDVSAPDASPSPEQIYRNDFSGVAVITDQQTQVVQPTLSSPGGKQQVEALGSGFVIDKRGDIVTNDHVIQGSKDIRVAFSGSASYPADVVGGDPSTDVAVIRVSVPPAMLKPLQFADSSGVEVGDSVYAIGNPFGLERTMTAGIVSATGRDIQAPNGVTIPNAIQTDAAINHGNSGGPLLDRFGRVIGVNSQIEGGTVDANVGVGFAIPSAMVRSIANQLIANGKVAHAWLGVQVVTVDPTVQAAEPGLPRSGALVVQVIKRGPAAKAGLQPARVRTTGKTTKLVGGDVIVAVDGKAVSSSAQLTEAIARHKPGDKVDLRIVRRGVRRTVAVTLGNAPT